MSWLVLLGLLACRSTLPADSAASDSAGPALGVDPTVPAGPDEARAGVVVAGGEDALFGGITAEGQVGDVKLYNDRVQVVIQGAYRSHGYVDTGGQIIDVDVVRDDGTLGRDTLEDFFLGFSMSRLFDADSVEIVADGSDGGSAVVQAHGTDVPWGFMTGLFEYDGPLLDDLYLDITTTYELPPASDTLIITSTLTNTGEEPAELTAQEGIFASGEDLLPWAPGRGYAGPQMGALTAASFVGRQGEAAFSVWSEDADELSISALSELAAGLGIFLADHPRASIDPGESLVLSRRLTIAPDLAATEARRREGQGEALLTLSGTVADAASGQPVPGVQIHLLDADDQVQAVARSDGDGAWQARLPAGAWSAWAIAVGDDERVELPAGAGRFGPYAASPANAAALGALDGSQPAAELPAAAGRPIPDPVDVELTEDRADLALTLDPPGLLHVELTDDAGAPLPGVIELRWRDGAPPDSPLPADLHDALGVPDGSRAAWVWTTTGSLDLSVLPGGYTVSAGHSWRYEQSGWTDVDVAAGDQTDLRLTLAEAVPHDAWLSMDSHLHASPSFDGALPMEHRLATCAATGVELPVTTDHDGIADYRELARAMGLDGRLQVFVGTELTTLLRGHYNIYPLTPADGANGGAIRWWEYRETTPELFARMRELAGPDAVLQVNHPRTPGMNDFARYDPALGAPDRDDYWSWDFDLFELLNGGVDDLTELREDWFSYLDFGYIRVPVGVSDTHYRFIPCGLGRTDVFLDTQDPAVVSTAGLLAALRAGHVVVAAGTTLRASLHAGDVDALPGDTVVATEGTLDVRVAAPSWIHPGTLRIYRNSEVIVEQALDGATDGVWFDGVFDVSTDQDAWFAVEVQGTDSQGDIWRNATPYAMTNAFFMDVDGDGWRGRLEVE